MAINPYPLDKTLKKGRNSLQLTSIYNAIRKDLDKVEENLSLLSKNGLISAPQLLNHALKDKGKRIRPALTLLAGKVNNYNLDLLLPMATAVELLHIATLVHDDAVDGSRLRWGNPTVSSKWGKEKAIILGDYLFATSADLVSTTENVRVMRLFAQALMTISAGELRQNIAAYNVNITREEYYELITCKTASLFSMACETGAILGRSPVAGQAALKNYGTKMGIAFQIIDDILDLTGTEKDLGKPVGNDLMHGTLTLPVLIFREMFPGDSRIVEALENKGDGEFAKKAVEAVSGSVAIKEAYNIASQFCRQAAENLKELPGGPARAALESLSHFIIERTK
ncbi:MAG: polyprenyl synthetase family protein [Dehalococcoidia bacterium]|nr:polyprenyl synthetase family protein [Dehalococcoidia bacterium]